jgi:hypothetical protein
MGYSLRLLIHKRNNTPAEPNRKSTTPPDAANILLLQELKRDLFELACQQHEYGSRQNMQQLQCILAHGSLLT